MPSERQTGPDPAGWETRKRVVCSLVKKTETRREGGGLPGLMTGSHDSNHGDPKIKK